MPLGSRISVSKLLCIGVTALAALFTSSCTDLGLWGEREPGGEAPQANVDAASVWELTLMAGRYGAMLDQARTILNLPEPDIAGEQFPSGSGEGLAERQALSAQQVRIAKEFYADVARACTRRKVPTKLKAMACAHRAGVPLELRQPAPLEIAALSARNDALDKVVMPWWDAACAVAGKPGKDDEPVCPME